MNTIAIPTLTALLALGSTAFAAEALPLPGPDEALDAAMQPDTWERTLEELTFADRLVVVAATVGEEIVIDPGFRAAHIEIEDLWIADVSIARRGKSVKVEPTQPGTTRLFVADKDGWVLEYELRVEAATLEDPELAAYEVDESIDPALPTLPEDATATFAEIGIMGRDCVNVN